LQQYYLKRTPYNISKNTPRETRDPPKLQFYYPRKVAKWHQESQEKMRERGERFWHNRVTVKNPCENEEGRRSFI
jgi:hypothetical protein